MTETVLVIEFLNIVIYLNFGACNLLFFKNFKYLVYRQTNYQILLQVECCRIQEFLFACEHK